MSGCDRGCGFTCRMPADHDGPCWPYAADQRTRQAWAEVTSRAGVQAE